MKDYLYYIEKAKKVQGFKTDLQLNQALGFKGSVCTLLRKNKMHLSDDSMVQLAKLADENPTIALADLNIMRSEGQAQHLYMKIAEQLRHAAVIMFGVVILMGVNTPAQAASQVSGDKSVFIYYGKLKALFSRLFAAFNFITPQKRCQKVYA